LPGGGAEEAGGEEGAQVLLTVGFVFEDHQELIT
jgi:hypothetical protein